MACLRKARVTIPKLSPTHTRARILQFCPAGLLPPDHTKSSSSSVYVECTDPFFVLECTSDLVAEGFRAYTEDGKEANPLVIVESHDEGDFGFLHDSSDGKGNQPAIRLNEWYDAGHTIGMIDDGDDDDDDTEDWLWQAYSYKLDDEDRKLNLDNLPPHIATGKITN